MKRLKKRFCVTEQTVQRLHERVKKITLERGEEVDNSLQLDLLTIMEEHTDRIRSAYPEDSFARYRSYNTQTFMGRAVEASSLQDLMQTQIWWHPCLIKWCLNLKLLSSSIL